MTKTITIVEVKFQLWKYEKQIIVQEGFFNFTVSKYRAMQPFTTEQ
jgi:hypothetical protein